MESKHRHILHAARALRFLANLPVEFLGECALTAAYLINRNQGSILHGRTCEKLLKDKPSYDHIRVFGSLYYDYSHQNTKR